MHKNIILDADSYKQSHYLQYPPGTEYIYSYVESRGGQWDRTLFFGLQMFLSAYLATAVTMADIDEAEPLWTAHGVPFHRAGWEHIVRTHGGRLPVEIKAVPEGTVLPVRNVLATIVNTDPACFWLTSFLETSLLRAIWYPTTVATNSFMCKEIIRRYLDLSSDDPEGQIAFKLHDFGARGVSSRESAGIGGAAHLVNFQGTDTMSGVLAAREYYGEAMAGFSIPAAEHSTITAWGRDGEAEAYRNMLRQFGKPGALVACVSDSWDLDHAVTRIWGGTLKEAVLATGGVLVVRPDSGDPASIVARTAEQLGAEFGHTTNAKGYRVLHPSVRIIQGDGINFGSIAGILERLTRAGWSADNVAFGMGGGLLQQLDRDTLKFAMKCSAARVDGVWRDVWKDPVTDPGKASKRGRLALLGEAGAWRTVPAAGNEPSDRLRLVYRDGILLNRSSFAEIRARAEAGAIGAVRPGHRP
jgi:nicotinamide phosphoribosyltransferase